MKKKKKDFPEFCFLFNVLSPFPFLAQEPQDRDDSFYGTCIVSGMLWALT